LIGAAELTACVRYRTPKAFGADTLKHLNDASWFEPPQMFGFCFRAAVTLRFAPCRGNARFFRVDVGE
jgi:hypothetical protein